MMIQFLADNNIINIIFGIVHDASIKELLLSVWLTDAFACLEINSNVIFDRKSDWMGFLIGIMRLIFLKWIQRYFSKCSKVQII